MATSDTEDIFRTFTQQTLTIWTIESLFYGCYVVLFGIAMRTFARHKDLTAGCRKIYLSALTALFILGTIVTVADLVSNTVGIYAAFQLGGLAKSMTMEEMQTLSQKLVFVTQIGYLFANIIADFVLIHRCYVIWNSSKLIVILPTAISFASNCVGLSAIIMVIVGVFGTLPVDQQDPLGQHAENMLFAFLTMNVINNILLTILIAGKIWWILKQIDKAYQSTGAQSWSTPKRRYESSVALILESGFLYPVAVLIFEVLSKTMSQFPSLYAVMTQVAGIAPTLIIVRVQLGVSINSVEDSVGTLRSTVSLSGSRFETASITENVENGSQGSQSNFKGTS